MHYPSAKVFSHTVTPSCYITVQSYTSISEPTLVDLSQVESTSMVRVLDKELKQRRIPRIFLSIRLEHIRS